MKKPKVMGVRVEVVRISEGEQIPTLLHTDSISAASPLEPDGCALLMDSGEQIRAAHSYKQMRDAILDADGWVEEDEDGT